MLLAEMELATNDLKAVPPERLKDIEKREREELKRLEKQVFRKEMKEIEENDFNLNISRYIDTLEPEQAIDVKAELEKLWAAEKARDEATGRMNALLKEMGYVG